MHHLIGRQEQESNSPTNPSWTKQTVPLPTWTTGLLIVLAFGVIAYFVFRLIRRSRRRTGSTEAAGQHGSQQCYTYGNGSEISEGFRSWNKNTRNSQRDVEHGDVVPIMQPSQQDNMKPPRPVVPSATLKKRSRESEPIQSVSASFANFAIKQLQTFLGGHEKTPQRSEETGKSSPSMLQRAQPLQEYAQDQRTQQPDTKGIRQRLKGWMSAKLGRGSWHRDMPSIVISHPKHPFDEYKSPTIASRHLSRASSCTTPPPTPSTWYLDSRYQPTPSPLQQPCRLDASPSSLLNFPSPPPLARYPSTTTQPITPQSLSTHATSLSIDTLGDRPPLSFPSPAPALPPIPRLSSTSLSLFDGVECSIPRVLVRRVATEHGHPTRLSTSLPVRVAAFLEGEKLAGRQMGIAVRECARRGVLPGTKYEGRSAMVVGR